MTPAQTLETADAPAAPPAPAAARPSARARATRLLLEYGMVWILVALAIMSQILYPGFLDPQNLKNILSQNAPVGIAAVGMTFVIVAAGFDLSVGAILAIGAVVYATFADRGSFAVAAIITLAVGLAAGAINGLLVTRLRVNPFVATLGTASTFGGAAFLYSKSAPVVVDKPAFQTLGTESWLGIPIAVWILVAIFVIGGIALSRTIYGHMVFAVGGNDEAARLSGLRVDLVRASTYVISGACAVVGGIILSSRLGVGQADMSGTVALDAIAVVVIGGTSLLGGEGAMWRTAVGLLILATLNNLFDSLALDQNWQSVVKGTIVVGAVALDAYARRRRA
jgi:ribose transport system permease protein